MSELTHTDGGSADEQRKQMQQNWADDAQEKADELEETLQHLRALNELIEGAGTDELKDVLGPVMSEARHWNPRMIDRVEVRVYFGDDPGEIDRMKFSALQQGAYTDASGDWTWSIGPDRFLSYRDLRRAALDALGQAIGGATHQLEDAQERAEKYDHGL